MVCTNPSLLQLRTVSLKNFWTPAKEERKFSVIQLMFCTDFSVGLLKAVWGSQTAQRKSFQFPRPHQWTKAHDHSLSSAAKPIKSFEVEKSAQCQDIWLCTRRWEVHPAHCPGTEGHMCITDNGEVRTWTSTGKTSSREGVNWKQEPQSLMPQAAWLQAVSLQILGWNKITHLHFAREGANPPRVLKRNLGQRKVRQRRVNLHCKFR